MPQTQINESESNLCGFSSQKKAHYSSMRLVSPSFHRVAHINFAPAEMAQRPPSAFKIARKLILHVAGAVARAQRLSFRVKTPTGWEEGETNNSNSTYGSVSESHRSALLTQEDTRTRHHISPFIPQCTLRFPLWCQCGGGASTWLPSPSVGGPPSRPRPPLSWLLEAKTTAY